MSAIDISPDERMTLAEWMGRRNCRVSLIYSAARDDWTPEAFRALCTNRCPLLVISATASGYVFGGFATMPWVEKNGTYLSAPGTFLFRLRKENAQDAMKFAASGETSAVISVTSNGPVFGNTSGNQALSFFTSVTRNSGENFVTSGALVTDFSKGFQNNGQDNNALTGGDKRLLNVEVYTVEEATLCDHGQEWRRGIAFNEEMLAALRNDILVFEPPKKLSIPQANLLFFGRVGAGKSSYYNTLNSIFQGHVTVKATSGSRGHSVTTEYRQYELRPGRGQKPLAVRLCDTMGIEEGEHGLNIIDIPYILDGNISDGFQFHPSVLVTPNHPNFNSMPKAKDKIHVVALMVEATAVATGSLSSTLIDKFNNIITNANARGIKVAILLTKIDDVCADVNKDVSCVYRSLRVQECVGAIAEKLGVLENCVLPVMNYHRDLELNTSVSVLALYALRHLMRNAADKFDDMMERQGLYERPKADDVHEK